MGTVLDQCKEAVPVLSQPLVAPQLCTHQEDDDSDQAALCHALALAAPSLQPQGDEDACVLLMGYVTSTKCWCTAAGLGHLLTRYRQGHAQACCLPCLGRECVLNRAYLILVDFVADNDLAGLRRNLRRGHQRLSQAISVLSWQVWLRKRAMQPTIVLTLGGRMFMPGIGAGCQTTGPGGGGMGGGGPIGTP